MSNKAIFIDKDGTLIVDVPYNVDPHKIVLQSDCIDGLQRLKAAGYHLIIVSNQSGVARGFFDEIALEAVQQHIRALLKAEDIALDGFYYCPHHPEATVPGYSDNCDCRKPMPGMLLKAVGDLGIDLKSSWMIGDILNDVEAGNRAGCRSVLIDNGGETEWLQGDYRVPATTVSNINEAADFILAAHEQ